VQFIAAALAAATVVWFVNTAWFPVVQGAINQLPEQGQVRFGVLDWKTNSPVTLAENRFLALVVDLKHQGKARSPAQLQVEFGQTDFKVFSLLGFVPGNYPRDWIIAFNRPEVQPWWGAWAPPILALTALLVLAGLMISWALLATGYFWMAWLGGFFADRQLSLRGSWRLAGAALLPGALFMTGAIALYGLGGLDLVRLLVAAALHFLLGWLYLVAGVWACPPLARAVEAKANPFTLPKG
jgi:hypothetical protein